MHWKCSYAALYCIAHQRKHFILSGMTHVLAIQIEAASQLKMGKGGMHNPVSRNVLCFNRKLPHITFSRELHHQGVAQPFTVQ